LMSALEAKRYFLGAFILEDTASTTPSAASVSAISAALLQRLPILI